MYYYTASIITGCLYICVCVCIAPHSMSTKFHLFDAIMKRCSCIIIITCAHILLLTHCCCSRCTAAGVVLQRVRAGRDSRQTGMQIRCRRHAYGVYNNVIFMYNWSSDLVNGKFVMRKKQSGLDGDRVKFNSIIPVVL